MISHLADSDRLIDYMLGRTDATELLTPLIEQDNLCMSIVAYAEVREGLLDRGEAALSKLNEVLAGVPVLGIDTETADQFSNLRRDLRRRGELIPDHDLWIAATAIRHGLTLITRDSHFDRLTQILRP